MGSASVPAPDSPRTQIRKDLQKMVDLYNGLHESDSSDVFLATYTKIDALIPALTKAMQNQDEYRPLLDSIQTLNEKYRSIVKQKLETIDFLLECEEAIIAQEKKATTES
jgi:hypothetical protein